MPTEISITRGVVHLRIIFSPSVAWMHVPVMSSATSLSIMKAISQLIHTFAEHVNYVVIKGRIGSPWTERTRAYEDFGQGGKVGPGSGRVG